MNGRMKELQIKLDEYEKIKNSNFGINWPILKDILLMVSDIIIIVSNDMPTKLNWLKKILLMIVDLIKSSCNNLSEKDFS